MTIETHAPDRKALAHALGEAIQEPVRYLGTPSYGYQVGAYTIDREAAIHGEDMTPLREFLLQGGYITEDTLDRFGRIHSTIHRLFHRICGKLVDNLARRHHGTDADELSADDVRPAGTHRRHDA